MFSNAREIGHPCGRAIRLLLRHGVFPPQYTNAALLTTAPKLTVEVSCSPSLDKDFDSGPVTVTASGTMVRLSFCRVQYLCRSL